MTARPAGHQPDQRSPWADPPAAITVDFANLPQEPCFPAAESAVLGAVMLAPSCAAKLLPILTDEHFTSQPHRDTLAAAQTLWRQQRPVDPLLIYDQLRKDGHVQWGDQQAALFIDDCLNATYFPGNGTSYAATVLDYAARRRAVQAGVRIAQAAARGTGSIDDLATVVATEVRAVADRAGECSDLTAATRGPVHISAVLQAWQRNGVPATTGPAEPSQGIDL